MQEKTHFLPNMCPAFSVFRHFIKLFFVGLCWILAALTEDMPTDRKNCTQLHLLLRCAMLGRVMMPIGTASCTACNTRFIISPSPSGLPYGLPFPFGINGRRLSIARASSFSAFGLHHWLVASTLWFCVFCVMALLHYYFTTENSLKISTRYRVEMRMMLISGRRPYNFLNNFKNNFLPAGQSKNNLEDNLYITAK